MATNTDVDSYLKQSVNKLGTSIPMVDRISAIGRTYAWLQCKGMSRRTDRDLRNKSRV